MDKGIVGFNFEDQIVGTSELYSVATQIERLRAARAAANAAAYNGFVNARTDIFLKGPQP